MELKELWRRISANLGLEIPPASGSAGCPLCESDQWYTVLEGDGFRIEKCGWGCIRRTVPSPGYSPEVPPDVTVERLTTDLENSGGHRFARLLLDVVETHSHRGRLLDVGSGFGYMLKLAREDGYDAVGVEASPEAARLSKAAFKVEPIVGFFPEHKFEPCSFDVVVMNHVLEHMPDPFGAMVEAERILRPGGIVAVMFPNYASVMRWLMKDRWPGLQPSQHIWQLSSASVRMLMGTAGLEVSTPHAGSLDYHRGDRPWRKWLLWQALLLSAERVGLGDNEIMIGEKPIWRVKVKRLK